MSKSLSQRETLSCRHERIVLIEGTGEIQIQKENVLRFEARRETEPTCLRDYSGPF